MDLLLYIKFKKIGKQLMTFLVERNCVASEIEALLVGNLLLEHKHIIPIGVQTEFKGKKNEIWKFKVTTSNATSLRAF